MTDYEELKRLAEAATPGPWVSKHHSVDSADCYIAHVACTTGNYESEELNRNYIAAADPQTILALLAENEHLRQIFRNIYEVWSGSEGIPIPETAPEAYLLHLAKQMRDLAEEGMK